jgi:hypothetical protein
MFIVNVASPDLTWLSWLYRTVSLQMTYQLNLPDYASSSPVLVGFKLLERFCHVQYFVNNSLSCFPFSFVNDIVCRFTASNYLFGIFKLFFTSERFFRILMLWLLQQILGFLLFIEYLSPSFHVLPIVWHNPRCNL